MMQPATIPSLAEHRANCDADARARRLDEAVKAMGACGLAVWGATLRGTGVARFEVARAHVQDLRWRLADGSDEPRYARTGVALKALGELWAAM